MLVIGDYTNCDKHKGNKAQLVHFALKSHEKLVNTLLESNDISYNKSDYSG